LLLGLLALAFVGVWPSWRERVARLAPKQSLLFRALLTVLSSTSEHLSQDAAHTPEVNSAVVLLLEENDLGRSVPARDDVIGKATSCLLSLGAVLLQLLEDLPWVHPILY